MANTEVLDAVAAMPPMVSSEYHVVATGIATRLGAAEMAVLERCIADTSDPTRGFNALYVEERARAGVVRPTRLILPAVLGGGLLLAAFLT
ncbi:hypothetical protein SLV14_007654 [Streptomyces sp. Je 1-4]|uniref:hypothetical protein n=1 Tax=Streptomyces TaxID=1883 RepID=UPI0021DAD3E0|nr:MULTISPECIES: hypothetical protein [unclassified Streptomyces]UYB44556.1 hypothetical protein SLV14_007654 [Streptomyces sp. Je 1-4]UZQ41019.1 hypothetical protein SLV14N_007654 [Streptomyces sp. Je 1-4] [Streptomyces sp. Je 1-4 4N24]UZQ48436.1 hypothetical protein SLV14NA_007654 [Streptomyces sp. Je 1-4] [Streptomyces sp. Je 1-4 4N24_ara]